MSVPAFPWLPSQATKYRFAWPLLFAVGTKRSLSLPGNNKACVCDTLLIATQVVPVIEYCQVPVPSSCCWSRLKERM